MIAELKQVLIKPASYNKKGELSHDKYAAININVVMTNEDDEQAVRDLFDLLREKQVSLEIRKLKTSDVDKRDGNRQMTLLPEADEEDDEDEEDEDVDDAPLNTQKPNYVEQVETA